MKKQISILSAMCLALLSGGVTSAFANSATQPQPDGTDVSCNQYRQPTNLFVCHPDFSRCS